jgi:ferredoxin
VDPDKCRGCGKCQVENACPVKVAKVKDGKMAEVEKILEQRKEAIAAKWNAASTDGFDYAKEPVIYKSGNYIMLAVYEDVTDIRPEFERLIGEMEKK